MKLLSLVLSLLAAHGASADRPRLSRLGLPGMKKGTFSDDVAALVASATFGQSMGYCGDASGGPDGTYADSSTAPTFGWGTFRQILDHNNPDLGTFSQRFWYTTQYWAGPGAPVILATPGEQPGDGWNDTYLTNQRITGYFADHVEGAVVILEHRYYGESSPYDELNVKHLEFLTVDQAMRDLTYFAENWVPPFDTSGKSSPAHAPWVLVGGSYSGALTGWLANLAAQQPEATNHTSPFWAYYATSGVVELFANMWQYFDVVQQATVANCSTDQIHVMDYIDSILINGTSQDKASLKAMFMLDDLEDGDFVYALALGPSTFQDLQFYSNSLENGSYYQQFCDYLENMWPDSGNALPGPDGVGVEKALDGFVNWITTQILPGFCQDYGFDVDLYDTNCFQYLNATGSMNLDLSPDNDDRQWWWLLCNNPLGWFATVEPAGRPSIVSRLLNMDYYLQVCTAQFPDSAGSFGLKLGRRPEEINSRTGGWLVPPERTPRLVYTNGELDPWRPTTVSSPWRPDGPLKSSKNVPVYLIPGATHVSDVLAENWNINQDVKDVVDAETAHIVQWVAEFYQEKGIQRP
ncbi:hypothetical protein SEPCBS119000_000631 [Sporothrix epigloea]|uniref:Serine peptidase n=1 Tax=Sporothrix epigloea TaxID=1892477 RepID=A0ABP0D796_9PEZI